MRAYALVCNAFGTRIRPRRRKEWAYGIYQSIRCKTGTDIVFEEKMDIENLDMEWKESWSDKCLKTIAAFYNTKGGRMIIGRRDNGEYIGIQDVKATTKSISDSIRNKLHLISETHVESIEGKDCVIVDVPKGDEIVDYDGRFYFRVGNTTQ